jgi:hypothetical protein
LRCAEFVQRKNLAVFKRFASSDKSAANANLTFTFEARIQAATAARVIGRPVARLAKATATMAAETSIEFDRLHNMIRALVKRIEKIEQKPLADVGSIERTVGRLDATCAQLQNTMQRYFEANNRVSGSGEIIDLPARRN